MNKKIIGVLFAVFFLNTIHAADSDGSQAVTDGWGESVCGAQLSIRLSNGIVKKDSTTIFYTQVKNSSTNVIRIIPKKNLPSYILTDISGKHYEVMPVIDEHEAIDANPPPDYDVVPGETKKWSVSVKFGTEIEPGDYVIKKATQDIATVDNKVYTLKSNSLEVKVVK